MFQMHEASQSTCDFPDSYFIVTVPINSSISLGSNIFHLNLPLSDIIHRCTQAHFGQLLSIVGQVLQERVFCKRNEIQKPTNEIPDQNPNQDHRTHAVPSTRPSFSSTTSSFVYTTSNRNPILVLDSKQSTSMAAFAAVDEVQRVVHHVFLPPKLPQQADEDSDSIALINTVLSALVALRDLLPPSSPPKALKEASGLLSNIKSINGLAGGRIDEVRLRKILTLLPVGRTLAANVSSQNAAVLITRRPDELVFEEFELSPLAADVVGTEGRLARSFPGLAVAVPVSILIGSDFSSMVASTLSTMCHQPAPGMQ